MKEEALAQMFLVKFAAFQSIGLMEHLQDVASETF